MPINFFLKKMDKEEFEFYKQRCQCDKCTSYFPIFYCGICNGCLKCSIDTYEKNGKVYDYNQIIMKRTMLKYPK